MALRYTYVFPYLFRKILPKSRPLAGAGKSKLASRVISSFVEERQTHEGLAYFYCNRGDDSRQRPLQVLSSFVRQLSLLHIPPDGYLIQEPINSIYNQVLNEGEALNGLTYAQAESLLPRLLEAFASSTIILDALDECERSTRLRLIKTTKSLVDKCGHLKILITSRRDSDIESCLQSQDTVELGATENESDIRLFVRSELDRRVEEGVKSCR